MNEKPFPQGRYLVTGAAGFIGSHLSEKLVSLGCEVVGVDNFITGRPENIQGLLASKKFSFLEKDVIEPFNLNGTLAGIFHLASPASPVDYIKFPIETLRVGSVGSDNVLQLALKNECPILVASTSEVYGDPLVHPQVESYWGNVNPVGPRGCYDESKRYLEALTMAYHRKHQLKTRIVRIFNTYGPRMRTNDGRVVPNFCIQALAGKEVTVYGDGSQTRSFCYVDDLVEGLLKLHQSNTTDPVNLGNPNEITILEFAKRIVAMAGSASKISYLDLPEDDPKVRKPDISRAKAILGWAPKTDLEQGLRFTFEYFKKEVKAL